MSIDKLVIEAEKECFSIFKQINDNEYYFSNLVLNAFREENINELSESNHKYCKVILTKMDYDLEASLIRLKNEIDGLLG